MKAKSGTVFGGSLLVAGTAIGGGALAMPVLTGMGGFIPATLIYFVCWLFMVKTALFIMEVYLSSPKEVNLVSMAEMTLGPFAKLLSWVLYIFLFYSLTVAYIAGGGGIVAEIFHLSHKMGLLLFVLLLAPFAMGGTWLVDRLNAILLGGLVLSFLLFVTLGVSKIVPAHLTHHDWISALKATPVIFTAFGFQGLVPTLTNYLDRDPEKVKRAIFFGSGIALVLYIFLEALFLGIIPIGGLEEAKALGQSAVAPLKQILGLGILYAVGQSFALFAIVTSFLGVTLALFDFLADGLGVKKNFKTKGLLSALIFIPPLLFASSVPHLFLNALHYGGGIGCALLLGLLPILMSWSLKKKIGLRRSAWLFGTMLCMIFFELTIMLPWK